MNVPGVSGTLRVVILAAAAFGCSTDPAEVFDPTRPTAITLDRSVLILSSIGETATVQATVRNGRGDPITGVVIAWATTNLGVVTVDASGLVTSVANGTAEVTAAVGALTARASVQVRQASAQLTLSADTVRFASLGDTVRLAVAAVDALGQPIATPVIDWSSSAPTVASVSSSGLVTGLVVGFATIVARSGTAQSTAAAIVAQVTATITVAPANDTLESVGDTLQLQVVARDARGNAIPVRPFVFSSDAPQVAAVDSAGIVVSRADGLAAITVVAGAPQAAATWASSAPPATGQASVRVRQKPVRIAWAPLPPNLLAGVGLAGVGVRLEDARSQPVINPGGPVAIRLEQGSAAGVLVGPGEITPAGGVAELTATSVSLPGLNYRLVATWPGLPPALTPLFTIHHRFASLVVGKGLACGREPGGTWCWGDNSSNQLLLPGVTEAHLPTRAPALDSYSPLLLGGAASCGIAAGQLWCWANITFPLAPAPVLIQGGVGLTGFGAAMIENYGCGIKAGGAVCWGQFAPVPGLSVQPMSAPAGVTFTTVGTGLAHFCAISTANIAQCSGNNPEGQIGNGSIIFQTTLTPVAGGRQYLAVDGGWDHTCALTTAGALYCWGDNRAGQLGDPTLGPRSLTPLLVPTPVPLTTIHLGYNHGCGRGLDGNAYCWGFGSYGQIGTGSASASDNRVQRVPLPDKVAVVQAGANFSCALTVRGQAFCWGLNTQGQRGDGGIGDTFLPSAVGVRP